MKFNRLHAYAEPNSDLPAGQILRDHIEDLFLTLALSAILRHRSAIT
jgi:hypothetical protein